MSNSPQNAGSSLGVAERRLHARRRDISLAYVEIGQSNGGIILNISEGGLVLTAAEPLPDDRLPELRFQLPGSRNWIEVSGAIAWISPSKREAGVRFVDVSEEARDRIKRWMSSESAETDSPREERKPSTEMMQASRPLSLATSGPAISEPSASPTPEDTGIPDSFPPADFDELPANPEEPAIKSESQESSAASSSEPRVENSIPTPDRRRHPRRRDISLAYIDLGGDNGGVILNISESGLVFTAAVPLQVDHLPTMRLQLPDSADWIEASGEIVWMSDSKREGGVRFLTMKEEDRERIRNWVASETASRESQRVANRSRSRKEGARLLEMPAARGMKRVDPSAGQVPATPEYATPGYGGASAPAPRAARGTISAAALAAAAAPPVPKRGLPERIAVNSELNLAGRLVRSILNRSWGNIAAVVILASGISFLAGWFAAGPAIRSQFLKMFERSAANASDSGANAASPATSANENVPSTPRHEKNPNAPPWETASKASPVASPASLPSAAVPSSPTLNLNASVRSVEHSISTAAANNIAPPKEATSAPSRTIAGQPNSATTNHPTPNQPTASKPIVSGPDVSQSPATAQTATPPDSSRSAGPAQTANSLAPSPPTTPKVRPESFKGTVTVSFSPYPSIRVPAELKSQVSRQGASLQLGRLISRVDPVYPAEAERQRLEGIVRVHAMIGRDGGVLSVALISGAPLLAEAVMNAVLRWRYQPASIGGQAVEAEEDVVAIFKLANQAAGSN